jgi:hypothetical protein
MKSLFISMLLASSLRLAAFDWPGGTMQVPVVFRGEEVFAGWVPSSPWGSSAFVVDPVVELRDGANIVIAQQVATGSTMQWYQDSTRELTAVFTVPAGTYTVTTREGRRLIRISGEGWSGFRMSEQSVTEPTPPNTAPTITWMAAPSGAAHGQSYQVAARGYDPDGNLTQVNLWKNGQPFAFGGGGDGTDGTSGNWTGDSGPQTVTFTAQAVDAIGATSAVISHTVGIEAPPPAQVTLTTVATTGGSVSPGGVFSAGTTVTISATADSAHDFSGWSGGATGAANPLTLSVESNLTIQANFTPRLMALTTSANSGGSVTPGGAYPFGTVISLTAVADSTHRFSGWAGDATGANPSITLVMDGPKSVQAVFADKLTQTITFTVPANYPVGGPPLALGASASSGLPITYTVLSGPAVVSGGQLQITGPGAVTVQASQAGDPDYLPAAVSRTFNAVATAILKYRPAGRTILQQRTSPAAVPYVLEKP